MWFSWLLISAIPKSKNTAEDAHMKILAKAWQSSKRLFKANEKISAGQIINLPGRLISNQCILINVPL